MDLRRMLKGALEIAMDEPIQESDGGRNKERSRRWVNALAVAFQREYPSNQSFRVFWADNSENEKDFGLKELLFDISVCEVSATESAFQGKVLWLVRNAVWQVESEFAKNSREALYDFGKLVLGSAQNKLFIAPLVSREDGFLRALREPASFCPGSVSLAMVPHPNDWPQSADSIKLWRFAESVWSPI